MTFKEALRACKKVGTNHAEGDALRAMYANMIAWHWPAFQLDGAKFYAHLLTMADSEIANEAHRLLRDRFAALLILDPKATQ